jgi:hypothetical protein
MHQNKKSYLIALPLLAAVLFFTPGCWNSLVGLKKDKAEVQKQINSNENTLDERSREYTAAINDISDIAIENAKAKGEEPEATTQLIKEFANEDERIEGPPIERIAVRSLLVNLSDAKKGLLKQRSQNTDLMRKNQALEAENEHLNDLIEAEQAKGWFSKLIGWILALGIPGIIGLILLCVFFPFAGLPLVRFFIGIPIKMIPQLVGFLGLVGKDVVDATVQGIQEFKKAKEDGYTHSAERHVPSQETFSRADVIKLIEEKDRKDLELLSNKLSKHTDRHHKNIIDHRKKAMKIK